MGRNKKTGLDYFPFDIDFFQDLKIRKLIKYQGGKAVTVYALLLCNIYKQGYYMRWDEELPFIVSEQTGFEEAYIQEVIKCCLVVGLFSKELYESDKVLTSKGIQERYQKVLELCRRSSDISEFNLVSSEEKAIFSEEKTINSKKSAQRKGKRKEKEREKEKPLPLPLSSNILEIPLQDCYNEIKSDQLWMEQLVMGKRYAGHRDFMPEDFHRYLKLFFHKLSSEGVTAKYPKDAKSHFSRWLDIELKNRKDGSTGNYSPGEELTADGKRKGVLYV